jgi:hypothetical protein
MQPVLYVILTDIHANFQALQAVAADAVSVQRELDTDSLHFVVLGDVVDYGPQPNQCMEWVRDHAEIVIQGNHDMDVARSLYHRPRFIAPDYWPITIWTKMTLREEHKARILKAEGNLWRTGLCRYNARLPQDLRLFTLFHSSLTAGHQGHIDDAHKAYANIQRLPKGVTYGLFGHTHLQGYFVDDPLARGNSNAETTSMHLILPERAERRKRNAHAQWKGTVLQAEGKTGVGATPWTNLPSHRTLFNPGGLGQPRLHGAARLHAGRDNRASYMLLKSNGNLQFQFRRVPYPVKETIRLLRDEVTWPPHIQTLGANILKEAAGTNPLPQDAWTTLLRDYREALRDAPKLLPGLIEHVLIPQLQ